MNDKGLIEHFKETEKILVDNYVIVHNEDGTITPKIKHPEGTFMWAVEQMKQGKKVIRKNWGQDGFSMQLKENGRNFSWNDRLRLELIYNLEDIEATDWEIFEDYIFGDFRILEGYKEDCIAIEENSINQGDKELYLKKSQLDDLEKAIKAAREKI